MARWHSCNILQVGATRRVWQFDARKAALAAGREQTAAAGQPLPEKLVGKGWTSLWQPKLNVAWLAAENIFLRVVHLPQADLAETRAMVEFQLEKLSPLPVTQMVWGLHVLPAPAGAKAPAVVEGEKPKEVLQTIIVIMVLRPAVEEFLGKLEKDGFLADRLEVPLLDQLQSTSIAGNGAWVYPLTENNSALVAWWFEGTLQSLGFIHLPAASAPAELLREQLVQLTWAGELEGWLRGPVAWHLVVGGDAASEWQARFQAALEVPVKLVTPPALAQLAAATATRAVQAEAPANLLPPEHSTRYRQQLVDRLWMRGLFAALGVCFMLAVVFRIAVEFVNYQAGGEETKVASISQTYTNAIQLKARYEILKDRQALKYAALNCWQVTAKLLPQGATLNGLDFRDGKKLTLTGTANSDQATAIIEFNSAMRRAEADGQILFGRVDSPSYSVNPGNNSLTWSFSCEVSRAEELP